MQLQRKLASWCSTRLASILVWIISTPSYPPLPHESNQLKFHSYCGGLPALECSNDSLGFKFSWSPRGSSHNATPHRSYSMASKWILPLKILWQLQSRTFLWMVTTSLPTQTAIWSLSESITKFPNQGPLQEDR